MSQSPLRLCRRIVRYAMLLALISSGAINRTSITGMLIALYSTGNPPGLLARYANTQRTRSSTTSTAIRRWGFRSWRATYSVNAALTRSANVNGNGSRVATKSPNPLPATKSVVTQRVIAGTGLLTRNNAEKCHATRTAAVTIADRNLNRTAFSQSIGKIIREDVIP